MGKKGYEMKGDAVAFILEGHQDADDVLVVSNSWDGKLEKKTGGWSG